MAVQTLGNRDFNFALLQYCNVVMLQCCKVAMLQYCNVATLLRCNIEKLQMWCGRMDVRTDERTGWLLELLSHLKSNLNTSSIIEAAETLSAFAYQILWLLLETAIAIDHLCLPKFDRNFKN